MYNTTRARGFTLIELLVVIAIIVVLAAIIILAVVRSISEARQAAAIEHMVQLNKIIMQYRAKQGGVGGVMVLPDRLSHLTTKYRLTDDERIYLDPGDTGDGKFGPFPGDWPGDRDFYNTDLREGFDNGGTQRPDELPVSFVFPFAKVESSQQGTMISWIQPGHGPERWDLNNDGKITWYEYKRYQFTNGDTFSNTYGIKHYSPDYFPLLRSGWWSTYSYGGEEKVVEGTWGIANVHTVGVGGKYYKSTVYWEAYVLKVAHGRDVDAYFSGFN